MREILFKGQTRRYGEKLLNVAGDKMPSNWVYGGIFQGSNKSIIYGYEPVEKHVVYTDTVGQYTGLTDKNGTKIFEGDILKAIWQHLGNTDTVIGIVKYDNAAFILDTNDHYLFFEDNIFCADCEVAGNIHDNPELLEQNNA